MIIGSITLAVLFILVIIEIRKLRIYTIADEKITIEEIRSMK